MLKISTKLDYGIVLLQHLAQHHGDAPRSLSTIAHETGLPYRFLTRIAGELKKARLIDSFEGVHGGYCLHREPAAITLQEVSQALEPAKKLTRCTPKHHETCKLKATCGMAPWWLAFDIRLQGMLRETTLDQLI